MNLGPEIIEINVVNRIIYLVDGVIMFIKIYFAFKKLDAVGFGNKPNDIIVVFALAGMLYQIYVVKLLKVVIAQVPGRLRH